MRGNGVNEKSYNILVGKSQRKTALEISRNRRKDNFKMEAREMSRWNWLTEGPVVGLCEHGSEIWGHNTGHFLTT
jgi:hypothetical protein